MYSVFGQIVYNNNNMYNSYFCIYSVNVCLFKNFGLDTKKQQGTVNECILLTITISCWERLEYYAENVILQTLTFDRIENTSLKSVCRSFLLNL